MELGNRIKKKRLALGLTQEELAEKVGVKFAAIHKYENGIITNIPLDRVEAIANALNTTPAYLTGWDKELAAPEWSDEQERENAEMFKALTPEKREDVLRYMRYLLSSLESGK